MRDWNKANPPTPEQKRRRLHTNREWVRQNIERAQANKARSSHKRNLKAYGLDEESYRRLRAAQDDRCAICSRPFKDKPRPNIDHDHATGEIRGLLCSKCNTGIGMLGDDPDVLLLAVAYLRRNNRRCS